MKPDPPREHWSYSSVSQYLRCPLQFYFARVLKLPRATIPRAQALGAAVHSALAEYHRSLMTGTDVVPQKIRDVYFESWGRLGRENEIVSPSGSSQDDALESGLALLEAYLGGPPPRCITAVEEPVLVPITTSDGQVLERPLLVIPDLVCAAEDQTVTVHEIKTSGRSFSESEVATSLQATCYAHALHESTGIEPTVEYTVLVKTKTPRVQKVEAHRTASDYLRLGDLIRMVERAVDAGVFYPQESPLNCSGCPYFGPCRQWSGTAGVPEVESGLGSPTEVFAC